MEIPSRFRYLTLKGVPHTVAAVQIFFEGHDGAPADRILVTDVHVGAVFERTYLCAELMKTKKEFLGLATTHDEEDDEIGDLIDIFYYFTEKPSKENQLNHESWGTSHQRAITSSGGDTYGLAA